MRSKPTAFGKYMRKLRIDYEMSMKSLGNGIEYKVASLSLFELGKRSIQKGLSISLLLISI